MNKHKFHTIFSLLIVLLLLASCSGINAYFGGNSETLNDNKVNFYVPSNTTISLVIDSLIQQKIIDDEGDFQAVIDYKELADDQFGAGKYIIAPLTDYKTLINGFTKNRLENGNQEVEVKVTFNSYKDIRGIASKVSSQIEMDSTVFINYILSDSILHKYGFSKARMMAMFVPNTYRFYWDTDHVQFVKTMAKEFKKFWSPERIEKLSNSGLKTQSDAVTLASIVYKEQSNQKQEWKTIAGLYLNRLRLGIKLQSDPTFRYCWGDVLDGVETLTYEHRDRDCPYNTYIYAGLPPGPICIPPSQVVDAVLNAENNNYLYMCAKPDGNGLHNFARSLAQHNRNARAYRIWDRNRK